MLPWRFGAIENETSEEVAAKTGEVEKIDKEDDKDNDIKETA